MTQPDLFASETQSQESAILKWLQSGKTITSLESLMLFGCLRLSGRVYDLRKQGHKIEREMITVESGKHVAQYRLVQN